MVQKRSISNGDPGGGIKALAPALAEWFRDEDFRGYAVINVRISGC